MKLFSEMKNRDFLAAIAIINYLMDNKEISREKISEIANEYYFVDEIDKQNFIDKITNDYKILVKNNKMYYINEDMDFNKIKIPLNAVEKSYLRYVIGDGVAKLFLKEETIKKLNKLFIKEDENEKGKKKKENKAVRGRILKDYIEVIEPEDKKEYLKKNKYEDIKRILMAIRKHKEINYNYITRGSSDVKVGVTIPYKIEYSAYDKRFWLIMYNKEEKRSIKARLNNIFNVQIGFISSVSKEEIEEAINKERYNENLVLRIENKKNALERCLLLMDNYERVYSEKISDDVYEIGYKLFKFDMEEISKNMLYLGEYVTVVKPMEIRKKVIEKIKAGIMTQNMV